MSSRVIRKRTGAVLVCALVVLLIVGLLAAQTMKTMVVVRQGDARQTRIRQARELVELGRQLHRQSKQDPPTEESDRTFTIQIDASELGTIELIENEQTNQLERIEVTYTKGESSQLTASWEADQ